MKSLVTKTELVLSCFSGYSQLCSGLADTESCLSYGLNVKTMFTPSPLQLEQLRAYGTNKVLLTQEQGLRKSEPELKGFASLSSVHQFADKLMTLSKQST